MLTLLILKVLALPQFLVVSEKPLIGMMTLQSDAFSHSESIRKYLKHFIKNNRVFVGRLLAFVFGFGFFFSFFF